MKIELQVTYEIFSENKFTPSPEIVSVNQVTPDLEIVSENYIAANTWNCQQKLISC